MRPNPQAYRDEQDNPSWFRLWAARVLVFVMVLTVADLIGADLSDAYEFWHVIVLALIAGAGGPRIAQYLAPIASSAAGRVRGLFSRSQTVATGSVERDDDPVPDYPQVQ